MVLSDRIAAAAGRSRSEASITQAKAEATHDKEVREARQHKDEIYARRKMFGLMTANLERDSQLVSRELTRRLSRHDREERVGRHRP